jgi:hypothetical protein
MRKSYWRARCAKAVAVGATRLAAPVICCRPTPVYGEGAVAEKRSTVSMASLVRSARKLAFQ